MLSRSAARLFPALKRFSQQSAAGEPCLGLPFPGGANSCAVSCVLRLHLPALPPPNEPAGTHAFSSASETPASLGYTMPGEFEEHEGEGTD